MGEKLECLVCLEEINDSAPIVLNELPLCLTCFENDVKPQFVDALANETSYPVMWTGKEVSIDSIRKHFDDGFLAKWSLMQVERSVLPKDRHYCAGPQCGKFLGTICAEQSVKECESCHSSSCGLCATLALTNDHRCATGSPSDPFEGLTRGVDFQFCPKCATPVSLKDGCNHMTCAVAACTTGFCYICGVPAEEGSAHWDTGKPCPRYQSKGAANASFDSPIRLEGFIWQRMRAFLNSLRPAPDILQIDEVIETVNKALDSVLNLPEDRLATEDARELRRVRNDIAAQRARERAAAGDAEPTWLTNMSHLIELLLAGTGLYTAPLVTINHAPMGEDFKQEFIARYDESIERLYRDSEQGLATWPSIEDIYWHYTLAADNRFAELVDQAPAMPPASTRNTRASTRSVRAGGV